MKQLLLLLAGAAITVSISAQSTAHYELQRHSQHTLAVKATEVPAGGTPRVITLRPGNATAMQPSVSLKSSNAPLKAPGDINLIGFVSDNNSANPAMGAMYHVPYRSTQSFERIGLTSIFNAWGGVESAGTYYTAYQLQLSATAGYNYLYMYNTTTWTSVGYKMLSDYALFASAQATDPTDNAVYGSYMKADGTGYEFAKADFANATHNTICELSIPWSLCAIDAQGSLYAIDADGELYTVDKTTGDMTFVAPTGVTSKYLGGGVFDVRGNRILWSVCNDLESGLYSVDPATAETSLVTLFPNNEEVLGMFIGAPIAADDAPEQPADLSLDFPNGALSGTVSFTVPSLTYGGQQGSGDVKWTLTMNGMQIGTGTATYGQRVEAPATAYMSGNTTFIVTLSNDAGNSPEAKITQFIGLGTPAIPLVQLDYDEASETVTLTWDPVTKAVNEGYLDPDAITYTVTRYPDYTIVAEHTSATSVSDHLPIPPTITTYTYAVVAENGNLVSGTGNTVPLRLGTYTTPYVEDFTNMANMADFTILDENADGTSWAAGLGGALIYGMQNLAIDDWLITPGIELKAGHKYYVELTFRTLQMQPPYADIEVKFGNAPTTDGLSTTLIPRTIITDLTAAPFTTIVEADTDGKYYLGVHAAAELSNWVQVSKIVIKDATMPGPATNLSVAPGPDDSLNATVSFTAPSVDAAGQPLESIDRIDVLRGGFFVKSFENPAPGENLSFDDTVFSSGNYQWVITAYNADGAGIEASIIEYVGLDVPALPQNVKAVEDGNTGLVTLTWDEVCTAANGRPLSAGFINYRILNQGVYLDQNPDVTGNTYTARIADEGRQAFAQMGVQVYNTRGSNVAYADIMPVGAPYCEYKESFADANPVHAIAFINSELYTLWQVHADGAMTGPGSADADGGYAMMFCQYVGGTSTMHLGKFNLADATSPALGISIFNLGDDTDYNRNTLDVLVDKGNGFETVATLVPTSGDPVNEWIRRSVDLSQFASCGDIRIALRGTIVNFQYLPVDKITIGSTFDHNLSACNFYVPEKVNSGSRFGVLLDVENNGRKSAGDFAVVLLQDDKEVARKEFSGLAPDAVESVFFTRSLSTLAPEQIEYCAKIEYDADQQPADNTTPTVTVAVKHPVYPAPGTLSADVTDGNVILTWSEPSKDIPAQDVTESFEDGVAFVNDHYLDWTFFDGDGALTYYYGDVYDNCSAPKAYVVYDPAANGVTDPDFAPHSGNRYLAAVCPSTGVQNDDWAISPELSGDAQAVSFFARSLWDYDGFEAFEFLYSTSGTDTADFTLLAKVDDVPAAWTEYSFDLPAGAKHFAIRCVSNYQYMFMLDDVTFVPAGSSTASLEHTGYHVYRDEARISTDLLTACTHTDTPESDGEYTYTVTAQYNLGESVPTNRVLVTVAHDAIAGTAISAVTVTAGIGTLTVTGAEGIDVTVSDTAGRVVATSCGNLHVSLLPGCYMVKAGTRTTKVMVR